MNSKPLPQSRNLAPHLQAQDDSVVEPVPESTFSGQFDPVLKRSRFAAAVRSRSWDWLLTLSQRLRRPLDVQIADSTYTPLLEQAAYPVGADLLEMLRTADPAFQRAMSRAIQTRVPQSYQVEPVQVVCCPVMHDQIASGTLLLTARTQSPEQQPESARDDLELIGSWLCGAIEAHLTSAPESEEALNRVSSFCRILHEAATDGSDRRLVAAFAETVAVWHDFEAYGYVKTQDATFTREVTLAGADRSKSPATIDSEAVLVAAQPSQLSSIEIERLGFSAAQHLAVQRLGNGAGSWLIAIEGELTSRDATVLALYLSLLDDAIRNVANARVASAVASMSAVLFGHDLPPAEQAERAAGELRAATSASTVALTVTAMTGAPFIRAWSSSEAVGADEAAGLPDANHLVLVRRVPRRYTMKVGFGCAEGQELTAQDHQVANASVDVVESWVRRAFDAGSGGERRRAAEGFVEVLERTARQAIDRGESVTLLVLSCQASLFEPAVTQDHISRIRGQMRAGDLVDLLAEDEVGVLLRADGSEQTSSIVTRLRALLESAEAAPSHICVGTASRTPALPTVENLLQEARNEAVRPASTVGEELS